MRRLLLPLFALGLSAPALAAPPIRIVAAENFYGDLATQIGGSHVAVASILSNPDTDPHLFESSASTARTIADADIVLSNGADYDPWMDKLLSASTAPARTVLVAATLMGARDGANPHLWYEPKTLPAVAAALAAELGKRDPADAADFAANLQKFDAAFAAAISGIGAIRSVHAGIAVTATEPVFGYMVEAMGLKMLSPEFQLATMNGTEPGPSVVAGFEDSLRSGAAKILFYNSQVTDDTTTRLLAIAKASNIPVVGVTETEPAGRTIETWFASEIAATQQALAGAP